MRAERAQCAAVLLVFGGSTSPVLAHGANVAESHSVWTWWNLTPDVVLACVLALGVYAVGALRARPRAVPIWRHVAFIAGLAVLFTALASPVDPMAERLYFAHQIQHLLLRMVGPLLLALSLPQALLVAGLPRVVRRGALASALSSDRLRATLAWLGKPLIATALYVLALWIWQIPALHDRAVLDDPTHYLMHVTMLLAGVIFWFRVLDPRPPHLGPAYGVRLVMIWLSIVGNIVLGAWLTLKDDIYYRSYDAQGRLWDTPALTDERLGGLVIWIPGSMMSLVGVLVVIAWWGRREALERSRPAGPVNPQASLAAGRERARRQAISLGGFALALFAGAMVLAALSMISR